jgi:hypothetical protein
MNRKQRLLIKLLLTALVSAALVFSMLVVAGAPAAGQEKGVLSLEAQIPLPSVKGRIDHFSVDVRGSGSLLPQLKTTHSRSLTSDQGNAFTRLAIWRSPRASSTTQRQAICSSPVALMVSPRFLMERLFKPLKQ